MTEDSAGKGARGPFKIKVQLYCGEEIAMGPGKADLLEAIAREGSISAAGRALGISYRRTWLLVDTMNRCWDEALVVTAQGGSKGGGARLTERGHTILSQFRQLQADLERASHGTALRELKSALRADTKPPQSGD